MIVKLNLKSIIKYENFTKKSFNKFDFNDSDDLLKLLYCVIISNNNEQFTFDVFNQMINSKKITKEIVDKFNIEIKLIEQFTFDSTPKTTDNDGDSNNENYLKDIAALLIINAGMDANFVMNDLSITDINLFLNAYSEKMKQDLESKRLWCYLSILPHVSSSEKINTPAKFYPFPWEVEKEKIDEKNELKNVVDEFPDMIKKGAEILKLINQTKENNEK